MRAETRNEYRERIEAAVRFVLSRLDNPPSPVEIADHAGFSRFHFGRVFSLAVGEPLSEFVRRLRMERAAWKLENTADGVLELAIEAGYESAEGFSRAFRAVFLISPSEYRNEPSRHQVSSPSEVHWCPNGRERTPLLLLEGETSMEARIEKVDPRTVVALRHVGPYYLIGEKFGQVAGWGARHQVPYGEAIGIWYDNPEVVPAAELRSDACLTVPDGFALPPDDLELRITKVEGGEYAVATHMGSYEGLGDAWARFYGQAIPALGRELAETPSFEMYMNDCSKVPIEEVRTDLFVRLK